MWLSLLDTAKGLSDLSQQIALSVTSAELVEKELQGCCKRERESRRPRAHPRPVVGSPTDRMAEEALQSVGMVHDAPIADILPKAAAKAKRPRRSREVVALAVD